MPSSPQSLAKDLLLRLAGLGLISLALFAALHLFAMVHPLPAQQASPAEFIIAAIGVFSASAGFLLAVAGVHIFDQVEISARWASRPQAVRPPLEKN